MAYGRCHRCCVAGGKRTTDLRARQRANRGLNAGYVFKLSCTHLQVTSIQNTTKALLLSSSLLFLADNAISDETSSAQPIVKPFALEKSFFEGKGLTKGDHAVFEGEGLSRITAPVPFSLHEFHIGKITVSIYESEPGKVRIDGMPFDEFV